MNVWGVAGVLFLISAVFGGEPAHAQDVSAIAGKDVIHVRELDGKELSGATATTGTIGFVANLFWMFSFGWILFFAYIIAGIFNCITIIGIPFGIQSFKLAGISFWPVGRRVVTKEMAKLARERTAAETLEKMRGSE